MKDKVPYSILIALIISILIVPIVFAQQIPVKFVTMQDYKDTQDKPTLIDVRSQNSRANSNLIVPGAIWIDPNSGQALQDFINTADKDKPYIIFCSCPDDNYSVRAAQLLTKNGFKDVMVLKDGWDSIVSSGFITLVNRTEG